MCGFFIEIVLIEYLFHEFGIDIVSFPLDIKYFPVGQFSLYFCVGQLPLIGDVVDDGCRGVDCEGDIGFIRVHLS